MTYKLMKRFTWDLGTSEWKREKNHEIVQWHRRKMWCYWCGTGKFPKLYRKISKTFPIFRKLIAICTSVRCHYCCLGFLLYLIFIFSGFPSIWYLPYKKRHFLYTILFIDSFLNNLLNYINIFQYHSPGILWGHYILSTWFNRLEVIGVTAVVGTIIAENKGNTLVSKK